MEKIAWFCAGLLMACASRGTCVAQGPEMPNAGGNLPSQYAATAFGQGTAASAKPFGLTIYVTGLTSDETLPELEATLRQKGQNGLVSVFEKTKDLGRVAPTGSVGTGIRFVRISAGTDGGQHIVMATDRPIMFRELYRGTRSRDYKIGIVVLDVNNAGKGTGTFAPLCKVKFNKQDQLEIENYGQKPFRLANVYLQK